MTTVIFLVGVAESLSSRHTSIVRDAVLEDFFADEGWHGLRVPFQTRLRAVGGTGAGEVQAGRIAGVVVGSTIAESTAGVVLTVAPLGSQGSIDGGGINGRVGSSLRSNEAGKERNGDG